MHGLLESDERIPAGADEAHVHRQGDAGGQVVAQARSHVEVENPPGDGEQLFRQAGAGDELNG